MNFYKHYLGDYSRDTADLSLLEHGAYRVLLDHYYAQRGDVPADLQKLFLVCKARNAAERKAVTEIADRFFAVNGDGRRHNRRADEEIQKHAGQAESNRLVAEERERKRKERGSLNDVDNDPSTNRSTNGPPNHSQKPDKATTSDAPASEARGAAAGLPDCPQVLLVALYHDVLPTLPRMLEWNAQRQAYARSRWREKAMTEKYTSVEDGLAYWRRFFGYVAKSDFLMGRSEARQGRKPFLADLEWLLRPTNFAKVVEGKYHT